MKTVLLVGTLDTKGPECLYVRSLLEERGHRVLLLDAGVFDARLPAEIGPERIAAAGGEDVTELRRRGDRGHAAAVMQRGVERIARELYARGEIDGLIGLGGSGGTALAAAAARVLPLGVPKVILSTLASGDVAPYVGVRDVTMMHSVVDIAGLNRLSTLVLANAAGMIAGALEQSPPEARTARATVAASMFGVTTPCVGRLRARLERNGCDVVVFHATGSGGRALEELVRDGFFSAVADITTTELCDEMFGGVLSAGPERFDAAASGGVPQLLSVGALDMVNFWSLDTVPEAFRARNLYRHSDNVTLMRTTPDENRRLGRRLAEKLNAATGPAVLMLPLGGVSALDAPGRPFYWPEADEALFGSLRAHLDPRVTLIEIDAHINDDAFADACAGELLRLLES